MKKFAHILIFLYALISLAPASSYATTLDMSAFRLLPIQHEGRIKPLSSFAQLHLKQFSGADHLKELSAIDWLALSVFDPAQASEVPLFRITSKNLRASLDLADKKEPLYSLQEIRPGISQTQSNVVDTLQKPEENRSIEEIALLELHKNAALYTDILRSFSAILPLNTTPTKALETQYQDQDFTYLLLHKEQTSLNQKVKALIDKKGTDPKRYTTDEQNLAQMTFALAQINAAGQTSRAFRVFPASWPATSQEWVSLWEIILGGQGSPETKTLTDLWQETARAYRDNNTQLWDEKTNALLSKILTSSKNTITKTHLRTENLYTALHPLNIVLGLYVLAFFLHGLNAYKPKKLWTRAALITTALGITAHLFMVLARIYILARPPVATLYESVLFVSLICAGAALILSLKSQKHSHLITGLICAAALLVIAPVAAPSGDSLEVLVAVLNTNFWLATHVIIITAGYGLSIFSASLAHITLFKKDTPSAEKSRAHFMSLIALLFMVIGTALGGIWADQSWGRFWGWDPKENGALLICLWLIWLHHGRISGKLSQGAFHAFLAALNIIVALSWFGVNLLNVGLHSYGFTSGMATGLSVFCLIEIVLISVLWRHHVQKP